MSFFTHPRIATSFTILALGVALAFGGETLVDAHRTSANVCFVLAVVLVLLGLFGLLWHFVEEPVRDLLAGGKPDAPPAIEPVFELMRAMGEPSITLFLQRGGDGQRVRPDGRWGLGLFRLVNHGTDTQVTRVAMHFEVRMVDLGVVSRGTQWLELERASVHNDTDHDFAWDDSVKDDWRLEGLPAPVTHDSWIQLPQFGFRVVDVEDLGARFERGERCLIALRVRVWTPTAIYYPPEVVVTVLPPQLTQ